MCRLEPSFVTFRVALKQCLGGVRILIPLLVGHLGTGSFAVDGARVRRGLGNKVSRTPRLSLQERLRLKMVIVMLSELGKLSISFDSSVCEPSVM